MVEGKLRKLSQVSAAFLSAINGVISKLTTTNYIIQENGTEEIVITKSHVDSSPIIRATPNGTGTGSAIRLDGNSTPDAITTRIIQNESFLSIVSVAALDADRTPIQLEIAGDMGDKFIQMQINGDLDMTDAGAVIFNASNIFISAEITGNGMAQATAHGLGRTPKIAIAYPSNIIAASVISAVTADATNCTVTATATQKYRILAL